MRIVRSCHQLVLVAHLVRGHGEHAQPITLKIQIILQTVQPPPLAHGHVLRLVDEQDDEIGLVRSAARQQKLLEGFAQHIGAATPFGVFVFHRPEPSSPEGRFRHLVARRAREDVQGQGVLESLAQQHTQMPLHATGFAKTRRSIDVAARLSLVDPVTQGSCHLVDRRREDGILLQQQRMTGVHMAARWMVHVAPVLSCSPPCAAAARAFPRWPDPPALSRLWSPSLQRLASP